MPVTQNYDSYAPGPNQPPIDEGRDPAPQADVKKRGMFDKLVDNTKEIGGKVIDKTKEYGGKAIDATKEFGGKAIDATKEYGGKAIDKTKEYGNKAIDGIKEGGTYIANTALMRKLGPEGGRELTTHIKRLKVD